MSQNIMLDPVKRDYVVIDGSPVPSDRIEESAYYAIQIPEDNWVNGESGQGSRLYTLQNVKRSANIEQQAISFITLAVKRQLVQTGKASAVAVRNLATSRTGTSQQTEIVPSAQGISQQLGFIPV